MRKRFPGEMTVLGGFEMTSQTMRVSDPCYDRDVWCCGTFGKCKTGTWEAGVLKTDMGDWGVRLLRLDSDTFYIYHVAAVMVDNLRRLLLGINLSDKAVMDFDFPGVGFPV